MFQQRIVGMVAQPCLPLGLDPPISLLARADEVIE
jgi:hypothetical protein